MEDNKYQYDENGFREDLKDDPDVLHQPDADRTQRDLITLDYDETLAFLNGEKEVKTVYDFSDDVLEKIKEKFTYHLENYFDGLPSYSLKSLTFELSERLIRVKIIYSYYLFTFNLKKVGRIDEKKS